MNNIGVIIHFSLKYGFFYFNLYYTMNRERIKKLDQAFNKLAKNKFLNPQNCTQLNQTRTYLFELSKIIQYFEYKFNYVPSSARLLFTEYNTKQENMLFEKYKAEYFNK